MLTCISSIWRTKPYNFQVFIEANVTAHYIIWESNNAKNTGDSLLEYMICKNWVVWSRGSKLTTFPVRYWNIACALLEYNSCYQKHTKNLCPWIFVFGRRQEWGIQTKMGSKYFWTCHNNSQNHKSDLSNTWNEIMMITKHSSNKTVKIILSCNEWQVNQKSEIQN